MTLKEKVIIETYTGFCMTTSEERPEVYKYIEELIGRPVFTHELGDEKILEELRKKCKNDLLEMLSKNTISFDYDNFVKKLNDIADIKFNSFSKPLITVEDVIKIAEEFKYK